MYSTIVVSAWSTPNLEPLKADYEKLKTKPERLAYLRSAPSPRSYLVSPSWVADMLDEFGEDSPIYQVRVLGEFPPDAPDQLIPLHWIEAAQNRWEELGEKWWEDDSSQGVIMGADIARYGDAETVICSRLGDIVAPLAVLPKQDTMQTAGAIVQKSQSTGTLSVNIDVVGVGAGVYDRCKELKVPAQAVNVGEKAKDSEKFLNLRAEAYWSLRQLFEQRKIAIPPDQKLAGQLSSLKYKVTSSGKIQVESKEDMRKRNVASPDRADALCLAFCPSTKLLVSRCITAGKYTNTIDFRRR
jgi:hypothetical protein